MSGTQPQTDLDPRHGTPGAIATPWPEALARPAAAELYWLSTVRPDGRTAAWDAAARRPAGRGTAGVRGCPPENSARPVHGHVPGKGRALLCLHCGAADRFRLR